ICYDLFHAFSTFFDSVHHFVTCLVCFLSFRLRKQKQSMKNAGQQNTVFNNKMKNIGNDHETMSRPTVDQTKCRPSLLEGGAQTHFQQDWSAFAIHLVYTWSTSGLHIGLHHFVHHC
ncbi:MAG: hypothetical protein ACKPKO_50575, partial [Candidatus Fonsibacter sp.]